MTGTVGAQRGCPPDDQEATGATGPSTLSSMPPPLGFHPMNKCLERRVLGDLGGLSVQKPTGTHHHLRAESPSWFCHSHG